MASNADFRNSNSSAASIPLLVQDLNGATRQLDVPTSANVDEIRGMIIGENADASPNDFKLTIGSKDIEPGVSLAETPVIPAYSYATSLLQVIGSGRLEPDKTAQALNSINGVVRSLSNGVTDVNALCAAAGRSMDDGPTLNDPNVLDVGASVNDLFAGDVPVNMPLSNSWSDVPSPVVLVRKLSKKMPDHFVPDASEDFVRMSMRGGEGSLDLSRLADSANLEQMLGAQGAGAATGNQPSIQDIARARRNAKLAQVGQDALGGIENTAMPQFDIATQSAAAAASGFGDKSAVMARSGESTWMDNVVTTWAMGLARRSGALDNTPDGKQLKNHLESIDGEEMQHMGMGDDHDSMDVDTRSDHSSVASRGSAPATMVESNAAAPMQAVSRTTPTNASPAHGAHSVSTSHSTASSGHTLSVMSSVHAPPMMVGVPGVLNAPLQIPNAGSPSMRRATPIAPSPVPPRNVAANSAAGPTTVPPIRPVKRGRKLKNPDLTAEQRKQMRKEQKRKSARESRIRKKTIEEGYQVKLKMLISENGTLKKQVTDLQHRLQVLQGLLTVTVRPINSSGLPRPQAPHLGAIPAAAHGGLPNGTNSVMGPGPGSGAQPQFDSSALNFPAQQRRFDAPMPHQMGSMPMDQQRIPPPLMQGVDDEMQGPQPLLKRSSRTQLFPMQAMNVSRTRTR